MNKIAIALTSLLVSHSLFAVPPALDSAVAEFRGKLPEYRYALADLNGDSVLDAIVLITESTSCGTGGCTMLVLKGIDDRFEVVGRIPATREPFYMLSENRHGWRTLSYLASGGGADPVQTLLFFDGIQYPIGQARSAASTDQLADAQLLLLR